MRTNYLLPVMGCILAFHSLAIAETYTPKPQLRGPLYTFNLLTHEQKEVSPEQVKMGHFYLNQEEVGHPHYFILVQTPADREPLWRLVGIGTLARLEQFDIVVPELEKDSRVLYQANLKERTVGWVRSEKPEVIYLEGTTYALARDPNGFLIWHRYQLPQDVPMQPLQDAPKPASPQLPPITSGHPRNRPPLGSPYDPYKSAFEPNGSRSLLRETRNRTLRGVPYNPNDLSERLRWCTLYGRKGKDGC